MAFPFLTDGIHPSGWIHLPNSVTVKKKLLMRFTHLNTIKLFNTHHPGSFFFFFFKWWGEIEHQGFAPVW